MSRSRISSVVLLMLLCFPFHACDARNIGDLDKVGNIHKKNDEKLSLVSTELFIPKATEYAKGGKDSTYNEVFGSDYKHSRTRTPIHHP
ncbi:hypothetical protein OROGR_020571 [Orobanche gracilis]